MTHFIRRLCSALLLVTCFSYSNAQEITTQTHSISDDGYANVPLQFNFPYYGQTFNNSWMFSNGIISFQDPSQSGLNGSNLGVQPMSSTMGNQFNYSIFPLWTDLINISGTFRTDGTRDYQQYSWIGISPYYNGNRFNTFTVEIKPDGSISANYSLVDVDYGQIGLTGNTSLGEFDHIASSGKTTSLTDWQRMTQGTTSPPSEDPCITDPLSSPSCPNYAQNLLASLPATAQSVSEIISSTPESTGEVSSSIVQQPIAQSSTPAATVSMPVTTESQSSGGSGASLSTILNVIGREQARIASIERSTVESSVEQSVREADRATEQAEAVAAATVTDSIAASVVSAQSQMAQDQQQADQSSGVGINVFSASSLSISLPESGIGFKTPEPAMESVETATGTENLPEIETSVSVLYYVPNVTREETLIGNVEERSESAVSFSGFSAVNVIREEPISSSDKAQNAESTETVKQNVPNNNLAGDISLASLGAVPQGFDAYSSMLPDGSFYAPREIYQGQRNVDNARALRGLGTDRLHQEMVNQQYNQGAR